MWRWGRRVDWCAVVAVPVVTASAFLDPVDTLSAAITHLGQRWAANEAAGPRQWTPGDAARRPFVAVRPRVARPAVRRPASRRVPVRP